MSLYLLGGFVCLFLWFVFTWTQEKQASLTDFYQMSEPLKSAQ